MADDKDDDSFGAGTFEDGDWIWDETAGLIFLSRNPQVQEEAIIVQPKVVVLGAVQFREMDLIDQMRFRKRYQRKLRAGQSDVISLQDVKDIAIYTAPLSLMTSTLINVLHLATTERFLRALILYCQYYLQVAEQMSVRMGELDRKIRTPVTVEIENGFNTDLCDLRSLVAKEYSILLIGGQDTKKFHHMGIDKKKKSLSDKDAAFFESLLLVAIQIVWLALGRRSFNQLELEINRLFKTDRFNTAEHRLKSKYYVKLSPEERNVLFGECYFRESKMTSRSPLFEELICSRKVDYRMLGLGSIKYTNLPQRLGYMLMALTAPEDQLVPAGISLGIIGQSRSLFDIALHLLHVDDKHNKSSQNPASSFKSMQSQGHVATKTVQASKTDKTEKLYGYKDIYLPERSHGEPPYPPSFPEEDVKLRTCNETQRRRWINRLYRLTHAHDKHGSEYMAYTK